MYKPGDQVVVGNVFENAQDCHPEAEYIAKSRYHLTPALLLQFALTLHVPYETDHITVDGR